MNRMTTIEIEAMIRNLRSLSVPEIVFLWRKALVAIPPRIDGDATRSCARENLIRDIQNFDRGKTTSPRAILDNLKDAYPEIFERMISGDGNDIAPLHEGEVRSLLRSKVSVDRISDWHHEILPTKEQIDNDCLILFAIACDIDLMKHKRFSRPMFCQMIESRLRGNNKDFAVQCMECFTSYAKEKGKVLLWKIAELCEFDERTLRRKINCERDGKGRFRDIDCYRKIFESILKLRPSPTNEDELADISDTANDQTSCLLLAAELDLLKTDFSTYSIIKEWICGQLSVRL